MDNSGFEIELIYRWDNRADVAVGGGAVDSATCDVGLDLTNGNYVVGDTAVAAATVPNQYDTAYLRINVDTDAGETTFTQRGAVNEEVTVSQTAQIVDPQLVGCRSDGTRSKVHLFWAAWRVTI